MPSPVYIIDTSCLTQAHRVYYPFDIAPSFWDFMKQKFGDGTFTLINKVADEINIGKDALTSWMQTEIPASLELDCHADNEIMKNYGDIMNWGSLNSQFTQLARQDFADFTNADPFIVAAAMKLSGLVVSQEVSAPAAKNNIKLPDVCAEFNIDHINTFTLLRKFGFTM